MYHTMFPPYLQTSSLLRSRTSGIILRRVGNLRSMDIFRRKFCLLPGSASSQTYGKPLHTSAKDPCFSGRAIWLTVRYIYEVVCNHVNFYANKQSNRCFLNKVCGLLLDRLTFINLMWVQTKCISPHCKYWAWMK
jgi:hypothetical protein